MIPLCAVWNDDFTNNKIYQGVSKSVEWEVSETTESGEITEKYATISFNRLFNNEIYVAAKVNAVFNIPDDGDPLEVEIEGERSYLAVDKPKITFYIDEVPLTDSSKFYLGQKIKLSFEAKIGSKVIVVDKFKWENLAPKAVSFIFDTENFSNGFAMELQPGALENNFPTLVLYSHLSTENKQKWTLSYQIDEKTFSESGELSFQAPHISDVKISQSIPTVFPSSIKPDFPVIGFPGFGDKGTKLWMWGENDTDLAFDVGAVQLIRYFDSYVHQDGKMRYVAMDDFRLDVQFPYSGKWHAFLPNVSWAKEEIFFDGPETPIDWVDENNPLNSLKYNASTKFKVFVVCKPRVSNYEWVPVSPFLFEWNWNADAKKEGSTWFRVDGSFFPKEDIVTQPPVKTALSELTSVFPAGFPKWDNRFKDKEHLVWKDAP